MGKTYIGVNGKAQQAEKIYVGVNNVARQVKRAYVGDAKGIARLVYSFGILPAEYQQVEYIQSTGTQYINTELVHVSGKTAMFAKIQYPEATTKSVYFYNGVYAQTSSNYHIDMTFGYQGTTQKLVSSIMTKDGIVSKNINFDTNIHEYTVDLKNKIIKIDEESISHTLNENTTTGENGHIYLFATNYKATSQAHKADWFCEEKLYNFKWYENDILTNDFYPCYRRSDGEIGLYDIISNKFYKNSGTGTFIKGSNNAKKL